MTTYNNISFTTTTHIETFHGRGIMCDNEIFYCNSEEYYCDGSVVFRSISIDITVDVTFQGQGITFGGEEAVWQTEGGIVGATFQGQEITFNGEKAVWQIEGEEKYNKISYS